MAKRATAKTTKKSAKVKTATVKEIIEAEPPKSVTFVSFSKRGMVKVGKPMAKKAGFKRDKIHFVNYKFTTSDQETIDFLWKHGYRSEAVQIDPVKPTIKS